MTSHQVKYEGPASLAMTVATQLADASGIDLRSAEKQEPVDASADTVQLVLTVEATVDDVAAAVAAIEADLPVGARITVNSP